MSARDVWEVDELLHVMKSKVEAREISETVAATDSKQPDTSRRSIQTTASALVVTERNQP